MCGILGFRLKIFYSFAILSGYDASVAELVDALDSKSSVFGRVGSIPTRGTDKPQKSGNVSEFQNEARFFFEIKRSISFYGFQNELAGKDS